MLGAALRQPHTADAQPRRTPCSPAGTASPNGDSCEYARVDGGETNTGTATASNPRFLCACASGPYEFEPKKATGQCTTTPGLGQAHWGICAVQADDGVSLEGLPRACSAQPCWGPACSMLSAVAPLSPL